jgi:pSer/pThr/pTyr-binding forkhead associated (FHA) protein
MDIYARIVGRVGSKEDYKKLDKSVTLLPTTLGRQSDPSAANIGHICIGVSESTLSRYHAILDWNEESNSFTLKCTSKNGMVVDKVACTKDQVVTLSSKSAIRLGSVRLYFISSHNFTVDPSTKKPVPNTDSTPVSAPGKLSYFGKNVELY